MAQANTQQCSLQSMKTVVAISNRWFTSSKSNKHQSFQQASPKWERFTDTYECNRTHGLWQLQTNNQKDSLGQTETNL